MSAQIQPEDAADGSTLIANDPPLHAEEWECPVCGETNPPGRLRCERYDAMLEKTQAEAA